MTVTITHGAVIMTPRLVLDGYESVRSSGNLAHEVLGSNEPDITFGTASLRRGRLQLFFLTQTPAIACEVQHIQPGVFTLVDTDISSAGMTYVPVGEITTRPDPRTGRWIVTIDYREVLP